MFILQQQDKTKKISNQIKDRISHLLYVYNNHDLTQSIFGEGSDSTGNNYTQHHFREGKIGDDVSANVTRMKGYISKLTSKSIIGVRKTKSSIISLPKN